MPSRRRYLVGVGSLCAGGVASLAGCLGRGGAGTPAAQRWSRTLGDRIDQFAANETGLYATVAEEEAPSSLVRVDAASGERLWQTTLEAETAALYVDGERSYLLVVLDDDPRTEREGDTYVELVAFDGDGESRWRRAVPVTGGPIAGDDDRLYLPASGELLAFDHGGTTLWRTDIEPPGEALTVDDGTLFVTGREGEGAPGSVLAVDATSGERLWRRDEVFAGDASAPPAATEEAVFVDGGRSVAALVRASGDPAWRHGFGHGSVAALAADGDLLSVATGTDNDGRSGGGRFGTLYGLTASDGAEASEFRFEAPVTDAAFDGRRATVLVEGGRLVVTDLGDYPTGTARGADLDWDSDVDGRVETVGEEAYVANSASELLCLSLAETTTATEEG